MDTTETTKLHPLHALYLGRSHGEAGTLALRAGLGREGTVAGDGAATARGAAAPLVGLGLAVARLVGKLTIGT